MLGLVAGAAFGLGLLLVADALLRPEDQQGGLTLGSLKGIVVSLGPRGAGGATGALLSLLLSGWIAAGMAGAALGAIVPGLLIRARKEREQVEQMEAVAELAARLRDSIRAGVTLQQGLVQAAINPPRLLSAELRSLVADLRLEGVQAAVAERMKVSDHSTRILWAALSAAERLGARNTSSVLDALVEASTSRALTLREARARQARIRSSARVVVAVPIVLLFLIRRSTPEYLVPFDSPAGQLVLVAAFSLMAVGYWAMLRAGRIGRA